MRKKLTVLIAQIIVWALFGSGVDRTVDRAANRYWKEMCRSFTDDERKEIILTLLKKEWPRHHVHRNPPVKEAAG
jgi:hypothetical protein